MKSILKAWLVVGIWIALSCQWLSAQEFEGSIIYQVNYASKVSTAQNERLATMMGTHQTYSIKGGRYRSDNNGRVFLTQLYYPDENRLYNKYAQSDTWFWIDGARQSDTLVSFMTNKKVVTILGIVCDELKFECKKSTHTYYYPSDKQLLYNKSKFKRHQFGLFSEYVKHAGRIALKSIVETPDMVITSIAASIEPKSLPESLFSLPDGALKEKSPN
jgi:hypothetical protein